MPDFTFWETDMFKAAVFDMDGVLLDTEKVYRLCWKKNGMSIGLSEEEMELLCEKIAGGTKKHNAGVFKEKMGEDFDYTEFRKKTMQMFEEYLLQHGIDVKRGVEKTLRTLKERGIRMALATSTDRILAIDRLTKTGLYSFFDAAVFGDEIEYGKPEPDIYLKACEKLRVQPKEAVGVEDSINGILSASSAGLYTVMVVDLIRPNAVTKEKAAKTYYHIADLLELF